MSNSDIAGQVTDASGNAISNAQVYLWREDLAAAGGVVASTTADSNGTFSFTAHPDGTGSQQSWHVAAKDPSGNVQLQSAYGVTASLPPNARTWETAADWDAAVSESGVVHESVTNTDLDDAATVKMGFSATNPLFPSSLVHQYPFDQTSGAAADVAGSNDGSVGSGINRGASGALGTDAFDFQQSDNVSISGANVDATTNGITFSMLLKCDSVSGTGQFSIDEANTTFYMFGSNSTELNFQYRSGGNNPTTKLPAPTTELAHVACVFEAGGQRGVPQRNTAILELVWRVTQQPPKY
jgi:hypothetical protein